MDSTRNGSICRHFLNGYCRFGPRCKYRHEWTVMPSSQICRYFQKGGCWYGERCRYLHILQPEVGTAVTGRRGSVPAVSSSVAHAPSIRRGSEPALLRTVAMSRQECNGLESANTQHDVGHLPEDIAEEQSQETDLESVQSSENALANASHGKDEGTSSKTRVDGAAAAVASSPKSKSEEMEAVLQSKDVTCGICMDKVYEKPDERGQVFGILPNCNHPFCLECIMTWRKSKDFGPDVVRTCPQCRVRSAFYVPNKYWVEGPAKESVIAAFKKKASKKTCCFYDRNGCCPFKTECLYRHVERPNRVAYVSDDEDELDLLRFFITMTLLGGDDDTDDEDFSFYLSEEYGM
ncbi:makorin, ring finger protein, 4 isoform X2 [Melanotaenia boesemani]|uniref:makorin, ring finger protein, 4 isoform X2 n=1 Tax=Melanotaenia boesemani TaxID=1250792 RepID=UPI001C05384B|nr:makorin, ring finger protein, 4 isoform X2 [Melanotaenia boesemani]